MHRIPRSPRAQARAELRRETQRRKVNAHKARLRGRDADRRALKREIYRRIFGI